MDDTPPTRLYKYRSMQGESLKWVRSTVMDGEVFMPPAMKFNDPFDLRPPVSLEATDEERREHMERIHRLFMPHLDEKALMDEVESSLNQLADPEALANGAMALQALQNYHLTTEVGVYSMADKGDNLLMWAHYGDSHRGVCLEFDGESAFAQANAQRVLYSQKREAINPILDSPEIGLAKSLLTKSIDWAYEGEWRILWTDGPGPVKTPPDFLIGIVIGAMASQETIRAAKRLAQERVPPLRVRRALLSTDRYGVDLVEMVLR